jgi:hypothetical protein
MEASTHFQRGLRQCGRGRQLIGRIPWLLRMPWFQSPRCGRTFNRQPRIRGGGFAHKRRKSVLVSASTLAASCGQGMIDACAELQVQTSGWEKPA